MTAGATDPGGAASHPLERAAAESGPIRVATLADFTFPQGVRDQETALRSAGGRAEAGIAAWIATRVQALVEVMGVRAGTGEVQISFSPLQNPEGDVSWRIRLVVDHAS